MIIWNKGGAMTEQEIIKRYQFAGMDNVRLSTLRTIFETMFDTIIEEFEVQGYDEPGYNYAWTMWCRYE
jgi:hypothetical protein